MARQLLHLGVMETVSIRRKGYPVRRAFRSVVARYRLLLAGLAPQPSAAGATGAAGAGAAAGEGDEEEEEEEARALCARLCDAYLGPQGWCAGSQRLYLRDGQLAVLELCLSRLRDSACCTIQAAWRGARARRQLDRQRQAAAKCVSMWRRALR